MRIDRLIAEKYGKFDDFGLDLPSPDPDSPDLHLVIGPNEAGKSTLRQGILELFYGFPPKNHAMSYRHTTDTVFAANISDGKESVHWRRSRSRKAPLADASGALVPAATLARFLGATSEEEFKAMYCLGRRQSSWPVRRQSFWPVVRR